MSGLGQPRTVENRSRTAASVVLLVIASLAAVAGGVALYLRQEVVNPSAFASRTVEAMHQPALQRVVAREIAVQVVEASAQDLIAARPVIESVLQTVVASAPFGDLIKLAAEHGHRLLFEAKGGNVAFDVADAGTVVASAIRTLAPNFAAKIPRGAETVLLTLRRRSFAAATLRFADRVRLLGILLPPIALLLFAAAIAIGPDRRAAITRSGVALGVTGAVFAIALEISRRYVIAHVYGTEELSNADVRGAIGALWGAYLGDLMTWTLALIAFAWLVAAASASLLAPYSPAAGLARLRAIGQHPVSTRIRAGLGALALVMGLLVIFEPTLALRVLAIGGGALLVYVGVGELLCAIAPAQPRERRRLPRRSRRLVALGLLAAVVAIGTGLAVAYSGRAPKVHASVAMTCNGYAQLCNRRLDQVVFAGTHNSMSAADTPGWLIANQDRPIGQQLDDGIRLFKISTHYAEQGSGEVVHTDIAAAGARLNRVSSKLDPAARIALQRLSRSLSAKPVSSKRDIFLCHTLCELGATRMVTYLSTIRRFLELNPNQVIILFDEDYVSERDLQSAFQRAGLFKRLATLVPGKPLPTLGDLIRSRRNIVVFAQDKPSGKYDWNADAFEWIQDTPLGARKPGQFTCRLNRGNAGNPLLMMNDWADIFPPRKSPNVPLVRRAFILARARQCVALWGRNPNLILTDYYNKGDVVGAVAVLNGVGGQRAAAITPVRS